MCARLEIRTGRNVSGKGAVRARSASEMHCSLAGLTIRAKTVARPWISSISVNHCVGFSNCPFTKPGMAVLANGKGLWLEQRCPYIYYKN